MYIRRFILRLSDERNFQFLDFLGQFVRSYSEYFRAV